MTDDTDPPLPPRPTPEQVAAARQALDAAGTPKDTILGAGINHEGIAWARLRDRFAFLRWLCKSDE